MSARPPLPVPVQVELCDIEALIGAVITFTDATLDAMPVGLSGDALAQIDRVCTMLNGNTYLLNLASQRVRELID